MLAKICKIARTLMKKTYKLVMTMVLAAMMVSCRFTGKDAQAPMSPEQIRLEKICTIDTTSLRKVLNPDSIEGRAKLDSLTADAWMLIDDSTGIVINEKCGFERRYMASITKMMTALLALEKGNLSDSIDITEDVYINRDSRVRLGDGYVMNELIYEMMMVSDNDAAYALAKHVAGDTLRFYDMMNQKAQYLRMDSTHFANPNGMPNTNNYSSAADLIKLARYAMRDSMFASIVGTAERDIPLTDGRHMECRNSNALLHTYEGCIGIKTGFTYQAGYCLASAGTRHGHTLMLVLLNSKKHATRFTESAALLDYGFRVMEVYSQKTTAR